MKKCAFILFILGFSITGYTQQYYFHQFEALGGHGFTIPHRKELNYNINSRYFSGQLSYSLKTDGSIPWHHVWNFPEVGVGYLMTGLGNINTFGFAQSVFGFYGIPIIENENIILKYRFGLGLGYLTEKFDSRSNYYNTAIGSHFNAHIHFSLNSEFKPWDTPLYLIFGLNFNHYSNASFKKPNLGLNLVTINTGVKYMYSEYSYSLPKRTIPYMNNKHYFIAYYGIGNRQNTTYENKNYFVNTLVAEYSIRLNNKRAFGIGTDIVFDQSLKTQIDDDPGNEYKGAGDLFRLGFHLSHEVYLTETLSCVMQIGTYAYNRHFNNGNKFLIYNRLGIRYMFNDVVFANFMIRSHTAVADFAEIGIGIKIRN